MDAPAHAIQPVPPDRAQSAAEQALTAAVRAVSIELSSEGACRAALDAVEQVFGATSSWIMLLDPHARTLRTSVFRGAGSDVYRDASIPLDRSVVSTRACRERRVVFVPDVAEERGWYDPGRVHASGLRSLLVAPLTFRDKVLGILALDVPRFSAQAPPDAVDIDRLQAIAAQVSVALTNARLFEASEQDRSRLRTLLKQHQQLSGQITHLQREVREAAGGGPLLGESPAFVGALQHVELVAPADTTVLILGETGAGKDVIARLLHQRSRRASGPFIAVNCAALPEQLVESELFGHERGAFTGAVERKAGTFEIAQRGTIFLDEIGDLPLEAQAKLLRVLQDREVRRVGGARPIPVDVRVVAATNQDLEQAIAARRFRPDLFYRLGVFPIRLPALRERPEDIAQLAEHFVARFARKLGKPVSGLTADARAGLEAYGWPGNIRELQNVIERAVILADEGAIRPEWLHLPAAPPPPVPPPGVPPGVPVPTVLLGVPAHGRPLDGVPSLAVPPAAPRGDGPVVSLADAERHAILTALNACGWRISGRGGTADRLRMKPTTLHAKMKKLGIRRPSPFVQPSP